MIGLAFAGFVGFGGTFTAYAACSNPSPLPSGYAAPCPVWSVSPASLTQSGTLTLSATPQLGTDYIYTTAYYAEGSTWTATTLTGNNAAPSYSSGPASGSLSRAQLSSLSLGTNYVVLWDWLWDATAQCYKGPGLNQCNTGTWRLQSFNLTSSMQASLSISPATLTFPSQQVGIQSAIQITTLTNTGSTPFTITSEVINGDFQFGGTGTCTNNVPVNPGSSCTISIVFTPTQAGTRSGQVTVTDTAAGSPHIIQLSGTGTGSGEYVYSQSAYAGYTYSQSAYTAGANNYYVSTSGSDSNTGTSIGSPWATCNHAVASATINPSTGAVINFIASSSQHAACTAINRVALSDAARLKLVCTAPVTAPTHCKMAGHFVLGASNFVDIGAEPLLGFDYSNPNDGVGIDIIWPCGAAYTCSTGNNNRILGNYLHDIAQNAPGPIGIGCPQSGAILGPAGTSGDHVNSGTVIRGNIIDHFGTQFVNGVGCSEAHGIYYSSPGAVIENNIVIRNGAAGIQYYHEGCNGVISNNVLAGNRFGLIIYANSGCTQGLNTIDNNIIVNNSANGVYTGYSGPLDCSSGRPTLFSNNDLFGNGANFNNSQPACETRQNTKSENPTNTFVNYTGTASGDYHLKSGSADINAGTTQCVSGGISPCTPSTDFSGKVRPNPPSIGAYEQ